MISAQDRAEALRITPAFCSARPLSTSGYSSGDEARGEIAANEAVRDHRPPARERGIFVPDPVNSNTFGGAARIAFERNAPGSGPQVPKLGESSRFVIHRNFAAFDIRRVCVADNRAAFAGLTFRRAGVSGVRRTDGGEKLRNGSSA